MRGAESLADGANVVSLCSLWTADFGHCGNDLSGHSQAASDVVSSDVVGDQPEEWGQCQRASAEFGAGQLPNRMDVVA